MEICYYITHKDASKILLDHSQLINENVYDNFFKSKMPYLQQFLQIYLVRLCPCSYPDGT
jgi:hypothetical protein